MKRLIRQISHYSRERPVAAALTDSAKTLSWRELETAITQLSGLITARRVAMLMANGCAWAVVDLALQRCGATCVALPTFFSDEQLAHVLEEAACDLLITDQADRAAALLQKAPTMELPVAGQMVAGYTLLPCEQPALPAGTARVTYTSGSTGRPKGVCLSAAAMATVAISLATAVGAGTDDRTLSLLPLSTLLENLGGLYAPLYAGAEACVPDLADCGLTGSSGVDGAGLMAALSRFQPTSTILVPQLLKVLVTACEHDAALPPALRFIAVGGAHTAPVLIERARNAGLPVFEGYGLSEACSVVSINLPGNDRPGSVGKPLPHAGVRIANDGEIVVAGPLLTGYLGQAGRALSEWPTGDLGHIDAEGYLYISGRKRNAYATAYGRNVSPEWIESELVANDAIVQAAVFGEARPCNVAVVVGHPTHNGAAIAAAVATANQRLPDYARVRHWIVADAPFSAANGLASAAGAVDRNAVATAYGDAISTLYDSEETDAAV